MDGDRRCSILNALDVGTFVWLFDAQALDADDALRHILGLAEAAPLRTVPDLLACVDERDRYRLAAALDDCMRSGRDLTEEVRIRRPDGFLRFLDVCGRTAPATGDRVGHCVGACIDVTDARNRSGLGADALSVISHELRTPLNAIAGYTSLLLEGIPSPVTDRQSVILRRIDTSYRHLMRLVDGILLQSQAQAGRIEYRLENVPVARILDRVDPLISPQRERKALVYDCGGCDRALVLRADLDRTVQILLNLVANAVKFTPSGGRITVATRRSDGSGSMTVTDNGPGLTREQLVLLFEPFRQFAASAGADHGSGLGLAISRTLAREMRGDITVESAPGWGSQFTLTLPLGSASAAA